jgi:thiol-disulfide isomerase/thioredoxin
MRVRFTVAAIVAFVMAGAAYFVLARKPAVPRATFVLLSGRTLSTSSLRGQVYLVNFWATSCATCIKEMPQMVKTYERFKGRNFEFIAVDMSYDPLPYVTDYTSTRHLPFKVAKDVGGRLAREFYDVRLTPTTFLVDKQGNIVKRILGEPDFPELDRLIQHELAKNA